MSEVDEGEEVQLAAKKKLNFYDKDLSNPVARYEQRRAIKQHQQGVSNRAAGGDSCSSSDLTLSLVGLSQLKQE